MSEKKYFRRVDKPAKNADALERVKPLDSSLLAPKRQCSAMSRRTGEQCKNFCSLGLRTCRFHGSGTLKSKLSAAKVIAQASGYSAELLVELMSDPKVDLKTRVQISQDLLTRAGVNGKQEIEVQVGMMPKWAADLQELFVVYPDDPATPVKNEVVEDAVIVPDEQEAIEAAHDAASEQMERQRLRRRKQGYSGAPVSPPKAVVRNQPPRQTRDVSGPDLSGPNEP